MESVEVCGEGGRFRDLEASGERPWRKCRVLRSMGERGEAGEARRERPTGPMGEQGTRHLLPGEEGGRMAAFRRSRGVTGDLNGVRAQGDSGCASGKDLVASGEGKGTARGEKLGRGDCICETGLGLAKEWVGRGAEESCSAESE